jgi:hypothetical protein
MTEDTKEDDDFPPVQITCSFDVKMIRIVENVLIPSNLIITAEVFVVGGTGSEDVDTAFTKIRFWFESLLSRCVAFCRENTAATEMVSDVSGLNRTGNALMLTPDDPSDEHLAALFQSKMTALGDDVLAFRNVCIKSDNVLGLSFMFIGEPEDFLPDNTEWLGEKNIFEKPWWERNDSSMLDISDLKEIPAWAYSLDFLGQNARQVHAGTVIRPKFSPTIIPGGREDR